MLAPQNDKVQALMNQVYMMVAHAEHLGQLLAFVSDQEGVRI